MTFKKTSEAKGAFLLKNIHEINAAKERRMRKAGKIDKKLLRNAT